MYRFYCIIAQSMFAVWWCHPTLFSNLRINQLSLRKNSLDPAQATITTKTQSNEQAGIRSHAKKVQTWLTDQTGIQREVAYRHTLKVLFNPKWINDDRIFALMSFQTCMSLFLLWNTKNRMFLSIQWQSMGSKSTFIVLDKTFLSSFVFHSVRLSKMTEFKFLSELSF